MKEGKDKVNGLIGQAWAIEPLGFIQEYESDSEALHIAKNYSNSINMIRIFLFGLNLILKGKKMGWTIHSIISSGSQLSHLNFQNLMMKLT